MHPGEHIHIAVIDDDVSVCRSFCRLLRVAEFQPVSYLSAEDFLADTRHRDFACIILDIHLGGMSGLELMRRLIAARDATPIVFVTAQDESSLREQAMELGCSGFFAKAAPGAEILALVHRLTNLSGKGAPVCPPRMHLPLRVVVAIVKCP